MSRKSAARGLFFDQCLIAPHQLGDTGGFGHGFDVKTVCLHDGTVVLLVRAAQLGGHGNFVVEVGKRAVGIERTGRRHQIETYLKELRSRESLTEFRETDWLAMVDYITVHSKKDIQVTFKDGTEIKA